MPDPVLITTDLDRTLIFTPRATAQLGGALPADPVETASGVAGAGQSVAGQTGGELCRAARACLMALPRQVRMCVATSRSVHRLARLRLPFAARYAIAANGGVVLVDGVPDPRWAARIEGLLSLAAPAADVRAVLAGPDGSGGSGQHGGSVGSVGSVRSAAAGGGVGRPWLQRMGDEDEMCCLAIVDPVQLEPGRLADIARQCLELGWEASLIGRKLYAFPAGFGKEHAAAFVADMIAMQAGAVPRRLAAGDTAHDRAMLADADLAWIPAGSELARARAADAEPRVRSGPTAQDRSARRARPGGAGGLGQVTVTRQPGHAAAAQITREWLDAIMEDGR